MGGLMILAGLIVSTLLWASLDNYFVWTTLLVVTGFGAVGFYDDYLKVTRQTHAGFSGRSRLAIEGGVALVACTIMYAYGTVHSGSLAIPGINGYVANLGWLFPIFGAFVIVAAGNAVNLTDGLDGLAIVPVIIASGSFGFIAYLVGNAIFSKYLGVNFVIGAGELAIVCGAMIGAGMGFLWFNAPPAQIFMGRHRLARARRPARHDRGGGEARDRAGHRRRPVRAGGGVGDRPGHLVQADRQARLPDGADPPPFRAARLVRAADRHPLLDHRLRPRADRPFDAEAAMRSASISPSPACGRRWRREAGSDEGCSRSGHNRGPSGTIPHPTRLRRASFSRKREKEGLRL